MMKTPPCRVCGKTEPVMCFPIEEADRAKTICPDCCATAEHDDGETGHVFNYDASARERICEKCGLPRSCCIDDDYIDDAP